MALVNDELALLETFTLTSMGVNEIMVEIIETCRDSSNNINVDNGVVEQEACIKDVAIAAVVEGIESPQFFFQF